MREDRAQSFGAQLRRHREAAGLTQEQLAERAGLTANGVSQLERGERRRPYLHTVQALAAALALPNEARAALLAASRAGPNGPEALTGDAQAPPLVLTKILPPPPRRLLVRRPRLLRRLASEPGGDVTLIVAPAGWGKTTLLAAWAAGAAERVAWVTLDEGDADAALLVRYLIAALQRHEPTLGASARRLLDTPRPPVEAALNLVINEVVGLGAPLALALDDYHRVRAPASHQAVAYLIEHLPPNLRLLIASREDPPLPLARLRARGQLHELRAADLRFTPDEARAFFADVMGLALGEQEAAALEQRTEGWIAGLQLAALALRERADPAAFIQSFSGTHRMVLDYLAEEVLASLPPHLHAFLLQTSILERLCGPLCDAVLEVGGQGPGVGDQGSVSHSEPLIPGSYSQLILEQLERANLFVVPLDGQREWYRYHHLFGAVLRERLRQGATPAQVAALHSRATAWFEAQGLLSEAIDHALAGHDWQQAARLIEQTGDELLQHGGVERLQDLVTALPPAVRDEHPRIVFLHGLCVRQVYDVVAGRELFEQAAAAFERAGDAAGRGESMVVLADCYRMLGAFEQSRRALAAALQSPLPPAQRAAALLSQAYEAMAADAWPDVTGHLDRALDLVEQSGDRHALHAVVTNISSLMVFLPGGVACATRARHLVAGRPVAPHSLLHATDLFLTGLIQYAAGQFAHARHSFEQAAQAHERLGTLSQSELETPLWLPRCAAVLGDIAAADWHVRRSAALLERPTLALFRQQVGTLFLAVAAVLNWTQGRFDAVRAGAAAAKAQANSHEWPLAGRVRRLMEALTLLADQDWAAAERLLRDIYAEQRRLDDSVALGDAGLLLAHVCAKQGRPADALVVLDEVLARHQRQATPGLLALPGGPVVRPLLQLAAASGVGVPFAADALRLLPALRPSDAGPDALTARELEVVRLIAAGASNGEIAERLVVSVATVKKHINNIFAKLDARSRTQALVRARERGLL